MKRMLNVFQEKPELTEEDSLETMLVSVSIDDVWKRMGYSWLVCHTSGHREAVDYQLISLVFRESKSHEHYERRSESCK